MLRTCVRRLATRAGIANDDLARKAMLEPTTAARVGAEQYFRDAEREALEKRRKGDGQGDDGEEGTAQGGGDRGRDVGRPGRAPEEGAVRESRDDAIRGGLMAIAAFATGAGLYFSWI